ncbi:MAG: site-specific DNA-methyltransferase [Pyrinomonadaceae bacterium MAG19_C2-C3]|nr:site-specific DNA-methyltransferase [Pyrinomonadaceae bacterium MAG19_C2-C3]
MPELRWVGKEKVVNHHLDVPFRTLRNVYTFASEGHAAASRGDAGGNKIIHGDNLEALKALLPEYEGRVKCIYIDPPYNTGNENWIYNDNVNDPKLKKWLGQVVGREGEDLSRHDKWLCMMYPRLKLLRRLLADDGVIVVSIDDTEVHNLRHLLDEIFGSRNFIANIVWQKRYVSNVTAKFLSDMHDHILVYSRNIENVKVKRLERTEEQLKDYKNPDEDPRGLWRAQDLSASKPYNAGRFEIVTPAGLTVTPPPGRYWRCNREQYDKWIADNRIWFGKSGNGRPMLKSFLEELKNGITPNTWWTYEMAGHNKEATLELKTIFDGASPFDTPKPVKLLSQIFEHFCSKDSCILDSFAGSGTTAHAVLKLNQQDGGNRKFILIETMDYAENITAERARRVMNGYGEAGKRIAGTGGSFDYYEIGQPLFLDDGNLNETLCIDEIRRYVAYTENIPHVQQTARDNPHTSYLLGMANDTAYIFYYEPTRSTTLDLEFLSTLNFKPAASVIYADNCLLGRAFMQRHHITFKKIPRDITRF